MEVTEKCDDPNAIHRWNRFKCEGIMKPNCYKNHFRLMEENQELLETAQDVTIKDLKFCGLFTKYHDKKYRLNKYHECLRRIRSHGKT